MSELIQRLKQTFDHILSQEKKLKEAKSEFSLVAKEAGYLVDWDNKRIIEHPCNNCKEKGFNICARCTKW